MSAQDGSDESAPVSERVTEAIAKEMEKEPAELEPLYYSVAPECLNELFPSSAEVTGEPVRQFTFTYENHVVNVSHDGSVEVFPAGGTIPDLSPTDSTSSSVQRDPEVPD